MPVHCENYRNLLTPFFDQKFREIIWIWISTLIGILKVWKFQVAILCKEFEWLVCMQWMHWKCIKLRPEYNEKEEGRQGTFEKDGLSKKAHNLYLLCGCGLARQCRTTQPRSKWLKCSYSITHAKNFVKSNLNQLMLAFGLVENSTKFTTNKLCEIAEIHYNCFHEIFEVLIFDRMNENEPCANEFSNKASFKSLRL